MHPESSPRNLHEAVNLSTGSTWLTSWCTGPAEASRAAAVCLKQLACLVLLESLGPLTSTVDEAHSLFLSCQASQVKPLHRALGPGMSLPFSAQGELVEMEGAHQHHLEHPEAVAARMRPFGEAHYG